MNNIMVENFDFSSYPAGKVEDMAEGQPIMISGKMKVSEKGSGSKTYLFMSITDIMGKIANQLVFTSDFKYPFLEQYVGLEKDVDVYAVPVKNGKYINLDTKNIVVKIPEEPDENAAKEIRKAKVAFLKEKIDSISPGFLRDVVREVYNSKDFLDSIFDLPATETSAYSYSGGLCDYIVSTVNITDMMCESFNMDDLYPNGLNVNPDIMLAGALLCHIGRTRTLKWNADRSKVIKTEAGVIDNDLMIAHTIVARAIDSVLAKYEESKDDEHLDAYAENEDIRVELLHMIDSSRGQTQWGAISVPRTKHAMLLSNVCQIASTKGLFEELERKSGGERLVKAYDAGRMYFIPSSNDE